MSASVTPTGSDSLQAAGNALSYMWGQCTRYVAEHLSWVPAGWGNAADWLGHAQAQGFSTIGPTLNPPVGSIAVWGSALPGSGGAGHVGIVQDSTPSGFTVGEENWLGSDLTDIRQVADTNFLEGFILAPGSSSGPSGAPTTIPVSSSSSSTSPLCNFPVVGGLLCGIGGAASDTAKAIVGAVISFEWLMLGLTLVGFGIFFLAVNELAKALRSPEGQAAAGTAAKAALA